MKSSDLFTRPKANDGRRVNIPGPNGEDTGEWLHVHHVDCDAFRRKRADVFAVAATIGKDASEDERRQIHADALLELTASTVSAWSLEDEFSQSAMVDLLRNAPYLADWLDRKASDSAVFFGKGSTGSLSIAEPKQD